MKVDITIILDRSGSMADIALDTIGGVNRFLADQQAIPGEATFSLAQFDNEYEVVYDAVPIARVAPLTDKTFVPRGATALLDAIARTIDATGRRLAALSVNARPDKVIVVIVTDGHENASTQHTRADVFARIEHQRNVYRWEIVFLAANQDAILTGARIGIPYAAAMSYTASAAGTHAMYDVVSDSLRSVRRGTATAMAFSTEDREKAADGQAWTSGVPTPTTTTNSEGTDGN